MKYGVFIFATDQSIGVAEIARAAEERGFESLWLPEHVHIPVARETPYPLSPDGVLPEMYKRTYDPFVALGVAAGVTGELRLGTGICLVTERDPLVLAKEVASLDRLSGGRFLFGIGAGWLREEMEVLGTRFNTRWKVAGERIASMKTAWTEPEAEYRGEFVKFPKTFLFPKPIQKPHPPILIGAGSRWARQRVVDWDAHWIPNRTRPDFIEHGINDIRERAAAAGKDPERFNTTVFGPIEGALADYERMGVERCIFNLPSAPAEQVLPELDRVVALAGL
ncbi:MAG: LLM class F420-dependent oxidoreductase [Dehalococcoidia bacterium]